MPQKFLSSITFIGGRAQAVTFQPIAFSDLPSGLALLGAANTFTLGPQTVQTGADANKGIVLKYNSATQTGNLIEVLNATDVRRGGVVLQSTVADPLAFELKPGTRSYYWGTDDAGGYFKFMRSDSTGFIEFEPGSGLILVQGAGTYAYLKTATNSFLVLTAREDGGASTVDFNRRPTDDSTGVGGTVRCWTKTAQVPNALEVLVPGGASAVWTIRANGTMQPASLADASAANNSVYYSTDASKLVYKDGAGVVNNLY